MKKLITLFTLLLVVTVGSAQVVGPAPSSPSVPVEMQNRTDCDMYVQLLAVDASCASYIVTMMIPANTPMTSVAPLAGYWFEVASVTESLPPTPGCFAERIQVPWAACVSGYNNSETDVSCCGPITTASWVATLSTPSAPVLIIYD